MFEKLKTKGKSLRKDAKMIDSTYDIGFWEGYIKGLEEAEDFLINGKTKWE